MSKHENVIPFLAVLGSLLAVAKIKKIYNSGMHGIVRDGDHEQYKVYTGGPREHKWIATFDNFDEAQQLAFDLALKKCEVGKMMDYDTGKHYLMRPKDVTKDHPDDLVTFEYWRNGRISYYYGVHTPKWWEK